MNRDNLGIVIASLTLVYWVLFYVFILRDLYLSLTLVSLVVRSLFPVAILANIAGVVFGLVFPAKSRFRAIVAVALNIAPLIAAASLLWWLFFGVRI